MLYFAYGSNMNWQQMQNRCPSARFFGIALLPDHKLAFTRKSIKRGCGVADAAPTQNHNVWGIVYEITAQDIEALDKSEGYMPGREKNSYFRRERHGLAQW
jgi:gamma-glutamylcyclotransferase